MDDIGSFTIEVDGIKHNAKIIMNFELYGNYYCIYGVKNDNDMYDINCGKVVGQNVVPIDNENDKALTDKIIMSLTNSVKGKR